MAEHLVGSADKNAVTKARGFRNFSPQGLNNIAWSFGRQAQLAGEAAERQQSSSAVALTSGRLAV